MTLLSIELVYEIKNLLQINLKFNKLLILSPPTFMRISKLKVKVGLITANVFLPTDYSNLFAILDFIVIDWNTLSDDKMEELLLFEMPIFVYTCSNLNEYQHIKQFPINGIVSDITFL